jgi:hypothetical protein
MEGQKSSAGLGWTGLLAASPPALINRRNGDRSLPCRSPPIHSAGGGATSQAPGVPEGAARVQQGDADGEPMTWLNRARAAPHTPACGRVALCTKPDVLVHPATAMGVSGTASFMSTSEASQDGEFCSGGWTNR